MASADAATATASGPVRVLRDDPSSGVVGDARRPWRTGAGLRQPQWDREHNLPCATHTWSLRARGHGLRAWRWRRGRAARRGWRRGCGHRRQWPCAAAASPLSPSTQPDPQPLPFAAAFYNSTASILSPTCAPILMLSPIRTATQSPAAPGPAFTSAPALLPLPHRHPGLPLTPTTAPRAP